MRYCKMIKALPCIQVSRAMALNGHMAAVVSVSFSQDSKRFVKFV